MPDRLRRSAIYSRYREPLGAAYNHIKPGLVPIVRYSKPSRHQKPHANRHAGCTIESRMRYMWKAEEEGSSCCITISTMYVYSPTWATTVRPSQTRMLPMPTSYHRMHQCRNPALEVSRPNYPWLQGRYIFRSSCDSPGIRYVCAFDTEHTDVKNSHRIDNNLQD